MTIQDERYCPECGADWRASEIPRGYVEADHYGHTPPCKRLFGSDILCTCPPRFYSNLIGVYDAYRDRTVAWQCPACGERWPRD